MGIIPRSWKWGTYPPVSPPAPTPMYTARCIWTADHRGNSYTRHRQGESDEVVIRVALLVTSDRAREESSAFCRPALIREGPPSYDVAVIYQHRMSVTEVPPEYSQVSINLGFGTKSLHHKMYTGLVGWFIGFGRYSRGRNLWMTKCIQCKELVGLSVFNGTFSTNKIYCAISAWNMHCVGENMWKKALRETQTLRARWL